MNAEPNPTANPDGTLNPNPAAGTISTASPPTPNPATVNPSPPVEVSEAALSSQPGKTMTDTTGATVPTAVKSAPIPKRIGRFNLLVEGSITVTSDEGVVVDIPINALLPRALAPASIQGAQQQFETVLDQLVLKPAVVEFIGYLDRIRVEQQVAPKPIGATP